MNRTSETPKKVSSQNKASTKTSVAKIEQKETVNIEGKQVFTLQNEQVHEQIDQLKAGIITLFRRAAFKEDSSSQKGKLFLNAFEVNEEFLDKFNRRVIEHFSHLEQLPNIGVNFRATVRYSDLSTQTFDNLNKLIEKAGDKKDPERIDMEWATLLKEPQGMTAKISVSFETDLPLETQELRLLQFDPAKMELKIFADSGDWVEKTFEDLLPFFESAKIGGIYKPLLVFRNPHVVHLVSWAFALLGQIITQGYLSARLRIIERQIIIDQILNQPSLETKFDEFIRATYQTNSLDLNTVLILGGSLVFFGVMLVMGYILFPKLVPRSFISIGLSKLRVTKYQNVFRFIIFSVLVSGIIIPTLLSFFT